jgi:hypothetical protein
MFCRADDQMIGQIEIKSKDSVLGVFVTLSMSWLDVGRWRMLTVTGIGYHLRAVN